MKCPSCGNDLPENVSFCPYCMTRFGEIKDANLSKLLKRKNNMLPIIIGVSVAIAALVISVILIFTMGNGLSSYQKGTSNIQDGQDVVNPENYCGTWYNEDFKGQDPELEGGNILKIISMSKEKVIFDLCSYQTPPNSRIAELTGIEADIKNGEAEFIFGDDGWGNGGIGTIVFLKNAIYVNIKLTSVSTDSLWQIGTDVKFKKVADGYDNYKVDFFGAIGEEIDVVATMLRDFEYSVIDGELGTEYDFGGIYVSTYGGVISSIVVDYTLLPEGYRDNLCFSFGVDGNAEFEYVKAKLGEPVTTYEENGGYTSCFMTSEDIETYIKINYKDGQVVSIYYYAPIT